MPGGPHIVGIPKRGFGGPLTKPPSNAQIDWQHPLAQGLIGCWLMNNRFSKCGNPLSLSNTLYSINGILVNSSGYCRTTTLVSQSIGTFFSVFVPSGTWDSYGSLFNIENSTNNSPHELICYHNGTKLGFWPNIDQNSSVYWDFISAPSSLFASGVRYKFAITWNNGASLAGYINGNVIGALRGSASWTASDWVNSEYSHIGCTGGTYYVPNCYVELSVLYSRSCNASEIAQLSYAPYQFFWIPKKRVYFVPASGGTPQYCAATLAGEGTLAAALSTPKRVSAALTSTGTLSAGLTVSHRLGANLAGAGTLSARMGGSAQELAASLAGAGTISAALTARRTMSSAFAGAGTITGAVSLSKRMATFASGSGTMTVVLTSGLEVAPAGLDIGGPHNPTVSAFANTTTQSSFAV